MAQKKTPSKTDKAMMALPPADGQFTIPTIQEFIAILNAYTKVYHSPDEAIRHSRENARTMRRSVIIMEPLRARQMATAELEWHLEVEDNKDRDQLHVAKELTRIIEDIPDFLQLKMNLLEAIFFGKYACQLKYQWSFKDGQKRLNVADWTPVHGDTLVPSWRKRGIWGVYVNQVDHGEGTKPLTVKQGEIARYHELTPSEREAFVIHKHEIAAGDFMEPEAAGAVVGLGLRTYLYWTWYQCQEMLGWLSEYMERVGLGLTIYRFQGGNPQSEKAVREAAQAQAFNCQIIWPAWADQAHPYKDIERIEVPASNVDAMLRVVQDFYGRLIKQMIVGQVLSSEIGDTHVSNSTADFQNETFENIIRYDSINLQETLTHDLVRVLQRYNFPGCDYNIKFKINVDRQDPQKFLAAAQVFYNLGGDLDADQLREVIGLSKPTKDSSILRRTMTDLEEGALTNAGSLNDKLQVAGTDNEQEDDKAEGKSGANATKIDKIKAAINELGVNAKASDIMAHLQSQGLKVSRALVYGTLQDVRGPQRQFRKKEANATSEAR